MSIDNIQDAVRSRRALEMSLCLFLIACFVGMCAVSRPALEQRATWPELADDRDDELEAFLDETAEINQTGVNALPGDPEAWWYDDTYAS